MRPVNLLPAKYRPRSGAGDSRRPYFALGGLAALVIAVLMYVLAAKEVKDTNAAIASTQQQVAAAEAKAVTLKDFGDFAGIKESRLAAVRSLATARLDWERLFRELAHVLPERTWLTGFDGTSTAGATGPGAQGPAGPTVNLKGCAGTYSRIADLMVRLRELHRAKDVELTTTSRAPQGAEAGAASAVPTTTTAGASGGGGCGPYFSFEISVLLEDAAAVVATAPAQPNEVPARLGGGG